MLLSAVKIIMKPITKSLSFALFLAFSFQTLNFTGPLSITKELFQDQINSTSINVIRVPQLYQPSKFTVEITAYSSTPDQTDDTPFITASGTHVRDGVVAANFLKIGTKIKIPELYGSKVFVVEDRMASRYFHRVDIWFANTAQARKFGIQEAEIVIL